MDKKTAHIALLIMMKDEEKRLHVTLESIIDTASSIVAYDTGSTDKTIQILKDFSEKHKIPLRLKEGEFVNFSTSRNVYLDFADTFEDIDFYLLCDVNDELRGGDKLQKFANEELHTDNNAYLMCQHWWSGKYDKYFNTRFCRARSGWRYKGSVHEWMGDTRTPPGKSVFKMKDDIILYQDRTKDGNKSSKRFVRDKVLLLADHKKDPTEPRICFYLAQTCACLQHIEDAFYYYKLRSELEGFQEEKFHAYLRCGELSQRLGHNWYDSLSYFVRAFEHSERVEPLIRIAEYYNSQKKWLLAYTFANLACSIQYPHNSILFVDKHAYDYTRWHILGIVAYYCGKFKEGHIACKNAIGAGLNKIIDENNLKFYEKKEIEMKDKTLNMTKAQFVSKTMMNIKKQNSSITLKKLQKIALRKWKNRNKT